MVRTPTRIPGRLPLSALLALGAAGLAGCAQGTASSLAPQIGQKAPDTYVPGKPYQLSAEELSLDCKKLTGRMQLRILQIRDASIRTGSSNVARSAHGAALPLFGGTSRGVDPAADAARDRAMLEAMNQRLAGKNCPTFDLETELQPRSSRDTPTPVPRK